MSLYLFLIFYITSLIGAVREINGYKTNFIFRLLFLLFFIAVCISRVGHSYPYSDLTYYIDYFLEGNYVYFEPGYVWITTYVSELFGATGANLVAIAALWVLVWISISIIIIENRQNVPYIRFDKSIFFKRYKIGEGKRKSMFCVFFVLFTTYWGFAFASEGLRTGMAVSMLICSSSMILNGYGLFSLIPALLALLFHTSSLIFIPILIVLFCIKKMPSQRIFCYWICSLILSDVVIQVFDLFNVDSLFNHLSLIDLDAINHFTAYEDSEVGGYFSTQYITYHIIGLLMLRGDFSDQKYSRSVFLYFWGLTMGTIFQTTAIVMRIQWLFLVMNIYAITYMILSNKIKKYSKIVTVLLLTVIQSIMIVRYLGVTI